MTEETTSPAAPVRERKGRNTYIVNVGAEMREMEVEADDYEVTREGVWFSREDNTEAGSHVVVFASHPCLVRDAADEA